jgi:hypothetical protein
MVKAGWMLALLRTDTRPLVWPFAPRWRLAFVAAHRRHRLTLRRGPAARRRQTGDLAPNVDERSTDRLEMTGRCVVFPTQRALNLSQAVHAAFSESGRHESCDDDRQPPGAIAKCIAPGEPQAMLPAFVARRRPNSPLSFRAKADVSDFAHL